MEEKDEQKGQVSSQQGGGEDNDKVGKEFDATFKKLVALFQGEKNIKSSRKIPKNDVGSVITEILKESKEEKIQLFKNKAKDLLSKYVAFKKECEELERTHLKMISEKKKEYTKAMKDVLGIVDEIDVVEKDYYAALKDATK